MPSFLIMIKAKERPCENPECQKMFVPKYRSTEKHCSSSCFYKMEKEKQQDPEKPKKKKKQIPKMSKKRSKESRVYSGRRIVFLSKDENKLCKIRGTDCTIHATTIEHSMGRKGFADEQKRFDNVSLYLDEDYWKPACSNCNTELENNSELSKKHQLSKIHGGKKI